MVVKCGKSDILVYFAIYVWFKAFKPYVNSGINQNKPNGLKPEKDVNNMDMV